MLIYLHRAHLALQYVPKFDQCDLPPETPKLVESLPICKRVPIGVKRVAHGAELDHLERLAVQTWTRLAEEHGRAHLSPDHKRNDN